MDIYMILRSGQDQEQQIHNYFYYKYSIHIVIWKQDKKVDEVIKDLFDQVGEQKAWKLFVVDASKNCLNENPYLGGQSDEWTKLFQNPYLINGKDGRRPPEKIYVIKRRRERKVSGNAGDFLQSPDSAVPSCRFLIMDYSGKDYLRALEELKLASAVVLLGINEIPSEVMEAYMVYKIDIGIDEDKLREFLQHDENELVKREMDLKRNYLQIDLHSRQGAYSYRDYVPKLSASTFSPIEMKGSFGGISRAEDGYKWMQKKGEIASRINLIKKEQIRQQEELKQEMKNRISLWSTENISLDENEEKEIYEKIRKMQKDLNECYIAFWEMSSELFEEESIKEKELEKILSDRYSIKEVFITWIGIVLGLLASFLLIFLAEVEVKSGLGMINSDEILNILIAGLKFVGIRVIAFGIMFLFYWGICSFADVRKAIRAFNEVLNKINRSIKGNLSKYKKLFSIVYGLKLCQNIITRNRNFKKWKIDYLESLKKEEKNLDIEKERLNKLKSVFSYLFKNKENCMDKQINLKLKLNDNKEIYNPLFYVNKISITKEVNDANRI